MESLPIENLGLGRTCQSRISQLQKALEEFKDANGSAVARAFQKLKLNWNYHSNAIEGNQLTYGETVALLMHGVTAKGKSLKDHLDVKGHNEAIDYIMELISRNRSLSHSDVRELHQIILKEPYYVDAITSEGKDGKRLIKVGQYKDMPNHVRTATGQVHYYVEPDRVHEEMTVLLDWFNHKSTGLHPIVRAALFHHRFVAIHPFDDGNGRLGRILMNFILIGSGYPPAVISTNDRNNYSAQLSLADAGDFTGIIDYTCNSVVRSLELQLSVFEGKEIDILSDIDKEIALFKAGLKPSERGEVSVSLKEKENIAKQFIIPLAKRIEPRFEQIADLFSKTKKLYLYSRPHAPRKESVSSVIAFEAEIVNDIENGYNDFTGFQLSYFLDSYKLSEGRDKKSFELFFTVDPHLFIMKSSGISKAHNFDIVSDYDERVYYDKIDEIAKRVIEEFMSFTKSVMK